MEPSAALTPTFLRKHESLFSKSPCAHQAGQAPRQPRQVWKVSANSSPVAESNSSPISPVLNWRTERPRPCRGSAAFSQHQCRLGPRLFFIWDIALGSLAAPPFTNRSMRDLDEEWECRNSAKELKKRSEEFLRLLKAQYEQSK
jgi:hypothetical protein